LILAPDLHETLAKVDQFEIDALKTIDDYITRAGLNAPLEAIPQLRDGYAQVERGSKLFPAADVSTRRLVGNRFNKPTRRRLGEWRVAVPRTNRTQMTANTPGSAMTVDRDKGYVI
jgi:hypothetical protein